MSFLFHTSGSVGALGEQSPGATRPFPLPGTSTTTRDPFSDDAGRWIGASVPLEQRTLHGLGP